MIELSGIYKITCLKNNKFYIGSSVNIDRRLNQHIRLLRKNKHSNQYLQKDWNKYGEQNFKYDTIETLRGLKQLLIREKWWLDTTKCYKKEIGFNISLNPCSPGAGKFIDLTGQKFGRLIPIKCMGKNKWGQYLWLCKCGCGKEITIVGNSLTSENTKSCGCLNNETRVVNGKSNKIHGYTKTRIYNIYLGLKKRCNNPKNKDYKNYRKRKIKVCKRWLKSNGIGFLNFLKDIGEPPTKKHQLGRINKRLGYYKNNCKWVLSKENCSNKTNNHTITYRGKTQCLKAWAEQLNIKYTTLHYRIRIAKWSVEKAFMTP